MALSTLGTLSSPEEGEGIKMCPRATILAAVLATCSAYTVQQVPQVVQTPQVERPVQEQLQVPMVTTQHKS